VSVPTTHPIEMDEDCLTINVWAPERRAGKRLPVMVWIYGGAFAWGTSDDAEYQGDRMAADGVVFVSFNYRIGVLGFLAHPELSAESADGVSGNYGLMDQIAALNWIRRNIAAFGGDPGNITIMGQSAGAFSVAFHLVLPASKGLFHRGIVQSGAPMGRPSSFILLGELKPMEGSGVEFASEVGARSLAELRAVSPRVLVEADSKSWRFRPAIDGKMLPEHPYRTIEQGRHHDVPLIAGFNRDEGTVFFPMGEGTRAGLKSAIAETFGQEAAAAEKIYSAKDDVEAAARGLQLFGDVVFNWNTAALAVLQLRHGREPVYFYFFNHAPGFNRVTGAAYKPVFYTATPVDLGAYHSAEIRYVLRTLEADRTAADRVLSRKLSAYWLNFARRGDPNAPGLKNWPEFTGGKRDVLHIRADGIAVGELPFQDRLRVLGRAMGRPVLDEIG
jgi:para-nitrobenzyl esterase